jgi:hypothetical protein
LIDPDRQGREKARRKILPAGNDPFLAPLVGEFLKNEFFGNLGLILINRSWSRTALGDAAFPQ